MTRMEPTFIKAGETALYYNKMMDFINGVADKRPLDTVAAGKNTFYEK